MDAVSLGLALTPHGRLTLTHDSDAAPLGGRLAERLLQAFERGSGHGLLFLGADQAGTALSPVFSYWREFGARFVTAVCTRQETPPGAPREAEFEHVASAVPPMTGAEYLTAAVLVRLWQELDAAFQVELSESKLGVQEFLKSRNPAWNLVGR